MLSNRSPILACAATALILATVSPAHDMAPDLAAKMSTPAEDQVQAGESPSALVSHALKHNPGIKAAEYRVKSLRTSPAHTWSLESPQIGVEFYQAPVRSFPNPLKNQMEVDYSIQQAFPFPGKIGARIEAEHRLVEMGESDLQTLKTRITRRVKSAYYELYLLDRRMEFNRENLSLMGRFIEAARRQYEVGMGRQADILRAQSELTALKSDSIALLQTRRAQEGMLNAILNRKTGAAIAVANILAPAKADWTLEQVLPLVHAHHPGLQAMRSAIRVRAAEKTVAKKEYFPEFMVGGAYKNMLEAPPGAHPDDLEDYWSVMVGMSVPIAFWSLPKHKAGVVQSEANLSQAEQEYEEMRNMTLARAQEAWLKAESGRELVRLSAMVLLPQARQALESNQAAYQGGKGEFMTLLDAYRMRLMAMENSEMALMRLLTSQAELEEAVGLGWDEMENRISEGAGK